MMTGLERSCWVVEVGLVRGRQFQEFLFYFEYPDEAFSWRNLITNPNKPTIYGQPAKSWGEKKDNEFRSFLSTDVFYTNIYFSP